MVKALAKCEVEITSVDKKMLNSTSKTRIFTAYLEIRGTEEELGITKDYRIILAIITSVCHQPGAKIWASSTGNSKN